LEFVVLDGLDGADELVIQIGPQEAFALTANLGGRQFGRPMTYQFTAARVRSLGGRVCEVKRARVESSQIARSARKHWSTRIRLSRSRGRTAPVPRRRWTALEVVGSAQKVAPVPD